MIDKDRLYLLPWTQDHNANGWIEPTTHCQLKCPFCYRGADKDGHVPVHVPLEAVKRDIDELIRRRGVASISIAGGDPLLYPWLLETIEYIRSRGVEAMVLTNGLALDEHMLESLKKAGTVRVVIHIDKHQGRLGIDTEEKANAIRATFCDLFRKVGGIALGFIQPIRREDLDDLDAMIPFFKENSDVIDLVAFNRLVPVTLDGFPVDRDLDAQNLYERFKRVYGLEYSAYLGKTHSDEISWLFALVVYSGEHVLGSVDGDAFRFFQDDYVRRTGQYAYTTKEKPTMPKILGYVPFNASLRRITARYLRLRLGVFSGKNGLGKIHIQRVLLVNPPKRLTSGELDRCKGCPDAMLYRGKLVPSCWLEKVEQGEMVEAG